MTACAASASRIWRSRRSRSRMRSSRSAAADSQQRRDLALEGAFPLLVGAKREQRLGLGPSGLRRLARRAPRARWCPAPPRAPTRPRSSRSSSSARPDRSRSRASSAAAIASASRSASPRAARTVEPRWPSCSATAAISASDSCSRAERGVDALLRLVALGFGALLLEAQRLDRMGGGSRDRSSACSMAALHLDQAGRGRRPADGEVRPQDVAVERHRGDVGRLGDQELGALEVVDDRDLEQHPPQRRAAATPDRRRRRPHTWRSPAAPASRRRRARRPGRRNRAGCRRGPSPRT